MNCCARSSSRRGGRCWHGTNTNNWSSTLTPDTPARPSPPPDGQGENAGVRGDRRVHAADGHGRRSVPSSLERPRPGVRSSGGRGSCIARRWCVGREPTSGTRSSSSAWRLYDHELEHKLLRVTRQGPEKAGRMLKAMAEDVHLHRAREIVAVTDGAPWIAGVN